MRLYKDFKDIDSLKVLSCLEAKNQSLMKGLILKLFISMRLKILLT